ncbi:MAG TPA: histidinol dehydrogenase [Terriglobales bacterium]|nr:histidinol dehydrogenase [Terriglobales bacterium]
MKIVSGKKIAAELAKQVNRRILFSAETEKTVARIVNDVRKNGDRGLRKYAEKLDGLEKRQSLKVSAEEMSAALAGVSPEFREAIEAAAKNIRQFAEWQKPTAFSRELQKGVSVGQVIRPLDSVGCYVPGGRYPLPSTLLMTVIPAQVAGVQEIAVVSPRPARETLAAAALVGVKTFYRIGGAQAVAALAYGTDSIGAVNKIVGPGNKFVTTAKKLVSFDCSIDFLAGPTEALVISDDGNPAFIAADLLAQAEHDPDASVVFVTTSRKMAEEVVAELKRTSKANAIARESLKSFVAFVTESREQSVKVANAIASEHITIPADYLDEITSAGSIFVGDYSAQSLGDYVSGPNHTLPTGGVARYRGGLSVMDFLKVITVQEVSREGLSKLGPVAETLAEAEGLKAHAQSVRVRYTNA